MKSYLSIFLKGMVMGFAELIPGVSGGTFALILGIYKRLVEAISNINIAFLKGILMYTARPYGKWGSFLKILISNSCGRL